MPSNRRSDEVRKLAEQMKEGKGSGLCNFHVELLKVRYEGKVKSSVKMLNKIHDT